MRRRRKSRRSKSLTKTNFDSIVRGLALSPATHRSALTCNYFLSYYKRFIKNTTTAFFYMHVHDSHFSIRLELSSSLGTCDWPYIWKTGACPWKPLHLQRTDVDGKQTCLNWEPVRRSLPLSGFRHVKSLTTIPKHILYEIRHFYSGRCPFFLFGNPSHFTHSSRHTLPHGTEIKLITNMVKTGSRKLIVQVGCSVCIKNTPW